MTRRVFLYRRGDGNDGNFPRSVVELSEGDSSFAALQALVVNDYVSGGSRRRWIAANLEIDGEPDNPQACISYGPRGACAINEGAWLTAELQQLESQDYESPRQVVSGIYVEIIPIREALDKGARQILDNPRNT
jgi:hypothetical protein